MAKTANLLEHTEIILEYIYCEVTISSLLKPVGVKSAKNPPWSLHYRYRGTFVRLKSLTKIRIRICLSPWIKKPVGIKPA
jgi:hypothetical protein